MADTGSNKTIARNTIYLYIRSFLIMAVSLYSSRIVLEVLGIDDYGLYGAIGSIVAMFLIINGVLAAGSSRFLTFELGKENKERLKKTFSVSFTLHLGLACILFILLETIGLWFVNHKLNIPDGSEFSAHVVYQISIITAMLSLTQVPYTACIIAHERMNVYAYVGIAEVLFKLSLVFLLLYVPFSNKLIAYATILAVWSIGLQIWYRWYCHKRFEESHLMLIKDKHIYKEMLGYSLWDIIGQFCATGNNQGLNLLLNMFFGVSINAARAVAYQVENAVTQFSNNFLTAVNPQITKSYAKDDHTRFLQLISESSKFAFYLLYLISFPLFLEANYILKIWLVKVPETSVFFLRFALFFGVFRVITRPIIIGVHATGKIKYLNLTSGLYSATTFLTIIYLAYKFGAPYWACFVVQFINGFIITYFEIKSLKNNVDFSFLKMIFSIIVRPWTVCILASVPCIAVSFMMDESFWKLLVTILISTICNCACIYIWGLNLSQKDKVKSFIISRLRKTSKNLK